MNLQVINRELEVGQISIIAVSSSSYLQVGDTETISLYSSFDTPPESLIISPYVPL
ncbi:spore gernimation protein GerPD [Bacillus xiapuensis]|uniref:spore gernimation protein GerPD n=1 Tax=Bacillus xiapuensis TaxID=2014075 RepID=UPI000C23D804|nr:spore gernimation protein GerPD [Bacillus xiapuensis]